MDPLSIIASVVGILGAIKATYKTIQQIKDLPEAFKEVEKNLPLVHKILRNARNRLEEEKEQGVEISEDECEAVLAVLKHCEISAVTLKQILEELEAKCNKENNENDWKKAREWYRMALQYSKKKRVETLMEEIMSGVEKLVWRETFQLATSENVQSLRDAIKGLSEVEPSIEGFELESLGVINAEQHIAENATGQQNNIQGGINTLYSGKYNISGTSAQVTFGLTKVRSLDNRQTIQYRDKNHHVESFMADLFITDPRDDKARIKDAKGGLLNQSCAWLINHETFQDWYQDDSKRLLWLKGDPGKGKTMLMIGLIEELEGRLRAMGDKESCTKPILCYYFFEGTKSERSNATVMLRALIWLLVSQKNSLGKHLVGESGKTISKVISGPNAFTALSNVFQRILKDSNLPAVYILIDALDECNRGLEQVLSFINQSSSHPHVKWIVSGRNEDIIVSSLQPCATTKREAYGIDNYTCRLFLSLEDNEKAVSLQVDDYINQHMADIKVLRANDTLRQNVRDVLRDRSQGTFLWVHLAIKELKNAKDVLSKLENLPTGLGSLYKQIMDHLKGHPDSEDSLKILSTVILTFRPLHVLELWRLCGFPDEAGFDADVIKGFVRRCGSFLSLRENRVHVIHQSAKDYLNQVLFPQGKSICHADIAKASLETMTRVLKENVYDVPDAHGTPQYNLLIKEIPVPATNPLFPVRYLCSHWIAHLLKVDGIVFLRDGGFLHEFMKNCLIYWLEAVGLLGETMIVYQSLQRLEHALRTKTPNSSLQNLVSDINRFVGTFSWVISNAPLQLYVSARVFCPPKSLAYTVLKGQDPEWLISKPAVSDYWPPELATIEDCPGIFSPDGTLIGQIIQHTLYIRDSATAELMAVRDLRKPAEKVFDWIRNGQDSTLAFSFDNRLIAIVARTLDRGLFFGVIDAVFSPTNPIVMLDRPSTIQTLVFSPKGNYLACGCLDGTVQVWSTKSWQVVITYAHRDRVPAIDFSPDDSLIASASWDGTVSVRCTTSGSIVWTFEQRVAVPLLWHWVKRTRVLALAFSSDGKGLLSVSCSADVVRWDIRTGEPTKSSMLAGFDSFANLFALDEFDYGTFSYNGQLVALSCAGSTIVWNTVSAQLQLERKHVGDCSKLPSLSPLGKWLIVAGKIWEITTRPTDNMRAFIPTPMQITKDGLWIVYNYFVCTKSQIGKGNSSLSKGYNMVRRPLDLPDTAKICIRAIIRDVVELDHEAGAKTKQANEEDGDQMKTDKESTQGNSDESNDSDDYYDSDSDNPTEVERPASLVNRRQRVAPRYRSPAVSFLRDFLVRVVDAVGTKADVILSGLAPFASDAPPTSAPPTQRPSSSRENTSVEGFGDEIIAEPAEPPGSWVSQDYGESESAMGFARKIYRLGSQTIDDQQCSAIPGGACGTRTPLMRSSEQRLPISNIIGGRFPKQNEIDSLLEDYFESVHWFSLVIYEPRFRKRIESIKDGYAYPTEAPFLTLLSIMLCMAAWYRSKKPDQEGAEEWRLWSDELLRIVESRLVHIMDQHSIAAVQTLILLGSHHVYHGRPNLSFALLGATIKISHAMGLHCNLAHGSVDDVEERKRVWWTIYTWDRFASISYGRPLSINDEDCNVGMPAEFIESPFFKAESIEQGSLGVRYSPYQTQLTTLYLVASPALKTIFGSLSAQSPGQHFGGEYRSLVNDVTQKLLAWRRDLPSFLSLDLNRDYHPSTIEWDTRAHQLQSLSLQLTFDNVMIVLHRPFLARQIENLSTQTPGSVTDSPLAQAMAQHLPSHSSNSPSQNGQSPRFEENASSEYWWSAAVRTARITELPYLADLATDSHLVAFMAMNLFHAAIVLTLVALSDPLSDPAQAVKRTITRVFRLQERLGQRSALASQSSAVLKNLIFLLLRREGEAMLGPAPTKSGPINSHMEYPLLHQTNHEQALRLPLEAALNTDQRTGIQAGSNLSIQQRLNESLALVQQSELIILT
ncbi:Uncharacterized protein LW93_10046 [Fusarium fujikuroi]|nr:Uncharacterized protein LW93_10046 [Fusarium fujikuroi]